ncbi:MAG: TetR family transcriptional regulator [Xanthomonadales bacterium]|nr:TetR family transcriptional regulator [Xanthomonadales bacterium]NIN74871.1 TetR family transcriptional regulator [Xanthomonadales bacterium]NIO14955.1 TetR family transcriptional regulator [Xanthomonadales bacterium]NIP11898.1 TetR family transcriptional regulator [Xanthomonadales bacterium]NIP77196.1 TetR family transcriptional regulator [Xanthomonadales bacterium]
MVRRDTRELILATSLALFNRHGEPNVSTNHIATEADISPGNLYYHFHSKDDIALELFKRYLISLQPVLELGDNERPDTEELWLRLHLMFETMGRFRFLYRNLDDLCARIPNLRRAFHGLLAKQRRTLERLLGGLVSHGIMEIGADDAQLLLDNLLLVMSSWIPFAEAEGDPGLEDGSILPRAVARVLHLLLPYLRQPEASQITALITQYREA